jgi:hypothetical protein
MDTRKRGFVRWLALYLVLALRCAWAATVSAPEEKFDELQIGAHTYRNVTVTTRTTNYVFLIHSEGMSNFKYSELTPEERQKLHFPEPPPPVVKTNIAKVWAKEALSKLDEPRLRDAKEQALNLWHENYAKVLEQLPPLTPRVIAIAAGTLLLLHLLWSFCVALICLKVDKPGGIIAWVPILQVLPMLKAAGMSGWWFPVLFIPIVNIIPSIIWCVKIVSARGKNGLLTFFLIIPGTNLLAFLYLAFSSQESPASGAEKLKMMTLQDA